MSYQDDGGKVEGVMNLRDYFAAHALTMLQATQYDINTAKRAYSIADAMLEARK